MSALPCVAATGVQSLGFDIGGRVGQFMLGNAGLVLTLADERSATRVPIDLKANGFSQRSSNVGISGWGTGLTVHLGNGAARELNLSLDWESATAASYGLTATGLRFTTQIGGLRMFYRLGYTSVDTSFAATISTPATTFPSSGHVPAGGLINVNYRNAFLYQHTLGAELEFRPMAESVILVGGAYALFDTGTQGLSLLLPDSFFSPLSGNRSVLRNLENWGVSVYWAQQVIRSFDVLVGGAYTSCALGVTGQWDVKAEGGVRFSQALRAAVGYAYFNNSLGAESVVTAKVNLDWSRGVNTD